MTKILLGSGWAVGLEALTNFEFRAERPYRACLICGRIYQTEEDRTNNSPRAAIRRQEWARIHAREHSSREHRLLRLFGPSMFPEAAHKLAAFGLIDITGLVMNNELEAAYAESSATPADDADF